jgi:hypothetical protein
MGGDDEMVAEFIDTPEVVVGCDWIPHYGAALAPTIGIHYLET